MLIHSKWWNTVTPKKNIMTNINKKLEIFDLVVIHKLCTLFYLKANILFTGTTANTLELVCCTCTNANATGQHLTSFLCLNT